MHPISDKELDKLFQQRFEDAEVEPSGSVWDKIADKVDREKTVKRSFSVFWMAAASVIIVTGAGLWFYKPVEVIKLQGKAQDQMAVNRADDVKLPETTETGRAVDSNQPKIAEFALTKSVGIKSENFRLKAEMPSTEWNTEIVSKQLENNAASTNTGKKVNAQIALQTKQEAKIPARYTGDQSKLDVTQPDMIAKAEIPDDNTEFEKEVSTPKKIRSIGSLVNFVIAKVDKRDDKIIEFKDGEEGSSLSGINLGLVKFKSRK